MTIPFLIKTLWAIPNSPSIWPPRLAQVKKKTASSRLAVAHPKRIYNCYKNNVPHIRSFVNLFSKFFVPAKQVPESSAKIGTIFWKQGIFLVYLEKKGNPER